MKADNKLYSIGRMDYLGTCERIDGTKKRRCPMKFEASESGVAVYIRDDTFKWQLRKQFEWSDIVAFAYQYNYKTHVEQYYEPINIYSNGFYYPGHYIRTEKVVDDDARYNVLITKLGVICGVDHPVAFDFGQRRKKFGKIIRKNAKCKAPDIYIKQEINGRRTEDVGKMGVEKSIKYFFAMSEIINKDRNFSDFYTGMMKFCDWLSTKIWHAILFIALIILLLISAI